MPRFQMLGARPANDAAVIASDVRAIARDHELALRREALVDARELRAEQADDLGNPRQGAPSFIPHSLEIDEQDWTGARFLDHYPDLTDLEHRPWGDLGPQDAAYVWADAPPGVSDILGFRVGAGELPSFTELKPYFLTEFPTTAEELARLYTAYMRTLEGISSNMRSIRHPVSSGAVMSAFTGARKTVEELWVAGGGSSVMAIQMLAGIIGWFNANFVASDGSIKWDTLDQPVNVAIVEGAQQAASQAIDAVKAAGGKVAEKLQAAVNAATGAAKTVWWTVALLAVGGLVVVGLLGWRLFGALGSRSTVVELLPTSFR